MNSQNLENFARNDRLIKIWDNEMHLNFMIPKSRTFDLLSEVRKFRGVKYKISSVVHFA